MNSDSKYVLIKRPDLPGGWRVTDIVIRGYRLSDDKEKEIALINKLLSESVEQFESEDAFTEKYPPLTTEEILAQGMTFWEHVPKEEWPEKVKEYFSNKRSLL